jgi:hypothetical protein
MKFRVQNVRKRRVAKNCRAYIIGLYKLSNNKIISENLQPESSQLRWSGFGSTSKDIPYRVAQYVDVVYFSKHRPGWMFHNEPDFLGKDPNIIGHRGTYRVIVLVAGDGVEPVTDEINIDYNGDWKSAMPYDA